MFLFLNCKCEFRGLAPFFFIVTSENLRTSSASFESIAEVARRERAGKRKLFLVLHVLYYSGKYMSSTFHALLRLPFDVFKYRDRYTITADILKAIAKSNRGARKTHIMQRANLNTSSLNKYLDLLLRNGNVSIDRYVYQLTSRGMEILENIEADAMKMQWRL